MIGGCPHEMSDVPELAVRVAADFIVACHVAFVGFVMLGGFLTLRWRWLIWLHVPAVAWAAAVELGGWLCPLTPLENYLRLHSGVTAYRGDFIEHYIVPLLYPARLTRASQVLLGTLVLVVNGVLYRHVLRTRP